MTEWKKDSLTIRQFENRMIMGIEAAHAAAETIKQLLATKQSINIIFAAAPSQNEFLAALCEMTGIDWARVNAFHMDEYIGLPQGSPHTFGFYLDEHIFKKLSFQQVNFINGNAANEVDECERYAALLKQYPPDIVCMGIGENGHIAFNDPHVADFNDPHTVKTVGLDTACRQQQVNDGCFASFDDVPAYAITLTIPALMAAQYIFCMVPGSKKANAMYNTLNKDVCHDYPSTILRRHNNAMLFIDNDSAALLQG